MSTIPVRDVVNVNPNVLAATGSSVVLSTLMLTRSTRAPIGSQIKLTSAEAVSSYFGATSDEKAAADRYFAGFDNSNVKPGAVLFAQYPAGNVAAYLRGGNVSAMTLSTLQGLTGSLNVTIDGVAKTSTPNVSGATSFSDAADIIAAALAISGPLSASFTGAISGTTLTVSAIANGKLSVGDTVAGGSTTAGTKITALGTGTGGVGTYTVSASQTVASGSLTTASPPVAYDSVSGAFVIQSSTLGASSAITYASGLMATSLLLTQVTGAVLSQGSAIATPAAFMTAAKQANNGWKVFMSLFDPDGGSGIAQKLAFATWNGQQNRQFAYVAHDRDAAPTTTLPATGSLGYAVRNIEGTCAVWEPSNLYHAAFVCGAIASVDFTETAGRTNFKFRTQSGIVAGVTDQTTSINLAGNGYNFVGAYGPADPDYVFLANGVISGAFKWLDSYVNQLWLNASLTNALMNLVTSAKSVPYNAAGRSMIEAALADPINQGLRFGAYVPGVTLSMQQIVAVNTQAGRNIAPTLQSRGWYLQIDDASPAVRQARGSPPCRLWYTDGESVNVIELSSVALQ